MTTVPTPQTTSAAENATGIAATVEEFLADLAHAERSHHTIRCYRGDLAQLARHHTGPVERIDADVLRGFFAGITGQAPATRARKRAAVGEFLAWVRRNEHMSTDPMALIGPVSVPQRLPRGVEPGRVQRVLDVIPKHKLRDRVLFTLIASTGLRASEALGVYVEDLTLTPDDEHLTVTAKGGRQRTLLLDDPAFLALLRRYLRATGYTRGPLFRAAKNHIGGPLRYASAEALWRKYCRAVDDAIGLHQLRHAHASELINDGVPVETVRKRLGHRKISSTLLYAEKTDHAADNEIRAWRRHRPTPAPPSPHTATTRIPEDAAVTQRNRLACPTCGYTPTRRKEALQQRDDLATVWLEYNPAGQLDTAHHCANCAPSGAVTDLPCSICGDGLLLTGAAAEQFDAGTLPTDVRDWLHTRGWHTEPELTCTGCSNEPTTAHSPRSR